MADDIASGRLVAPFGFVPNGLSMYISYSRARATDPQVVAFRDWLRTNQSDRELYARLKRELAQRQWKYTQQYADAKTAVVEEILSRARRSASSKD